MIMGLTVMTMQPLIIPFVLKITVAELLEQREYTILPSADDIFPKLWRKKKT